MQYQYFKLSLSGYLMLVDSDQNEKNGFILVVTEKIVGTADPADLRKKTDISSISQQKAIFLSTHAILFLHELIFEH